jgi:hypothetical protein
MNNGTVATSLNLPASAANNNAADAPFGLRMAATTASVSTTTLIK